MEHYSDVLFAHGVPEEEQRLTCMAAALDPHTFARIESLRPATDWRCLELGAGTGSVARWIADLCPDGETVATDLDTGFLEREPRPNLKPLRHDASVDDFPEESFALIHARWFFTNLRDREEVLVRAVRWLRPGGWLLIEEGAEFPLLSAVHEVYRRAMLCAIATVRDRVGIDTTWSHRFPAQLAAVGLVDLATDGNWPGLRGGDDWANFWRLCLARSPESMIATGDVSAEDIDAARSLLADPDFFDLGMATMSARGRKPGP